MHSSVSFESGHFWTSSNVYLEIHIIKIDYLTDVSWIDSGISQRPGWEMCVWGYLSFQLRYQIAQYYSGSSVVRDFLVKHTPTPPFWRQSSPIHHFIWAMKKKRSFTAYRGLYYPVTLGIVEQTIRRIPSPVEWKVGGEHFFCGSFGTLTPCSFPCFFRQLGENTSRSVSSVSQEMSEENPANNHMGCI